MRTLALGLVGLVVSSSPSMVAAFEVNQSEAAVAHMRAAAEAAQRGDCRTALKKVGPVVDGKTTELPERLLAAAYDFAIVCNARLNDNEKAGRYARRATALTEASDTAWAMRFFADYAAKRFPEAVETLEAMTQGRGAALNGLDPRWLWGLRGALDKAKLAALEKRVLTIVTGSSYDPTDPAFAIEDGRENAQVILARRLLAEGDREGASKLVAGLTSVSTILEVLFTPDLRAASRLSPDLQAAADADSKRLRDLRVRFPDSLRLLIREANTLRLLGRPAEAVAVLETARSRVTGTSPFADQGDLAPWWWNELGYSHGMAGNYDAMVASFTSGAALNEGGASTPNVSQVINLGFQQIAFGKFGDALRTVNAAFLKRAMSPFGRMQALSVRGCALALSGQTAEAQAVLREATAHASDDPATVTDLLLCNADDEGAATSIVRRLADPQHRRIAMKELAHYAAPSSQEPKDPRQVRREQVAQRADVQAALNAAGGALTIQLQRTALDW